MNKKIQEQINQKYDLIRQKEEEIKQLRVDIDSLEAKKYDDQTKLIIKVAPSVKYLKLTNLDINIDFDFDKRAVRGGKEQKEFLDEIIYNIIKNKKSKGIVSLYTVCEHALNIIGNMIQEKKIPSKIVKVIIYDEQDPNGLEVGYDSHGYIYNWKYGLLSWM